MSSLEDYQIIKQIGQGAVGTVYYVTKNDQEFALKMIKVFEQITDFLDDAILEVNVQKTIKVDNVVQIIYYFQYNNYFCIVIEFCNYGSLETIKDSLISFENPIFKYQYIDEIIIQLLQAISTLHKLRICHKDIKPANILFDYQNKFLKLKLADFGCSEYSRQSILQTMSGTREYQAPEQQEGEHTFSVDIWATGCVLYFLLFGDSPFSSQREVALLKFKATDTNKFHEYIPQFYNDLIWSMLQQKSSNRLSADEILYNFYPYSIVINRKTTTIVSILGPNILNHMQDSKFNEHFSFKLNQYINESDKNYLIVADQYTNIDFFVALVRVIKTRKYNFLIILQDIHETVPLQLFEKLSYLDQKISILIEEPTNQLDRIFQKMMFYFK